VVRYAIIGYPNENKGVKGIMDTGDKIIDSTAKELKNNIGRCIFSTQILVELLGLPENSTIRHITTNPKGMLDVIEFTVESPAFDHVRHGALIPQYTGKTTTHTLDGKHVKGTIEWIKH